MTAPECSLRVRAEEKTEGNPLIEEFSEKEPLSLKWKVFTSGYLKKAFDTVDHEILLT